MLIPGPQRNRRTHSRAVQTVKGPSAHHAAHRCPARAVCTAFDGGGHHYGHRKIHRAGRSAGGRTGCRGGDSEHPGRRARRPVGFRFDVHVVGVGFLVDVRVAFNDGFDGFVVGFLVDVRVEFNVGLNVGFVGLNVGFVGFDVGGSTSTGDSQRTVGTHTSTESTNETINETTATGEVAGASTTADTPARTEATPADQTVADAATTAPETPPEAPAAAEAPRSAPVAGSDRRQRQFEQRAGGARGVDPVTRSTAVNAAPSQPDISQVAPAVVDVAVNQPAAPQAVTAVTASTYPVPQTNLVATQPFRRPPPTPSPPAAL